MTITKEFIRYRATSLDACDLRPIPSVKWWARMVADTAESVEWAVNNDDLDAATRRVEMLQRTLDNLRNHINTINTGGPCGCFDTNCEGGCFT